MPAGRRSTRTWRARARSAGIEHRQLPPPRKSMHQRKPSVTQNGLACGRYSHSNTPPGFTPYHLGVPGNTLAGFPEHHSGVCGYAFHACAGRCQPISLVASCATRKSRPATAASGNIPPGPPAPPSPLPVTSWPVRADILRAVPGGRGDTDMAGPSWLAGLFAVVVIITAAYSASRLAVSRLRGRATEFDADALHAAMGTAMAGMLVPRLNVLPGSAWAAVFGAAAVWFGWRVVRARGPGTPGGSLSRFPVPHLVECAAMLYMLLPVHGPRPAYGGGGMAMPGMGTSAGPAGS